MQVDSRFCMSEDRRGNVTELFLILIVFFWLSRNIAFYLLHRMYFLNQLLLYTYLGLNMTN